MSAGGTPKRAYRCAVAGCEGILVASAVQRGVLEGVCCPVCGTRQVVYLGGYRPGGGVAVAGNGEPRTPPSEDGPVRRWRPGR